MATFFLMKCGGISILKFSTSNTGSLHKATGVISAQTPDYAVFVRESESLDGRGGREGVNGDRKEEVIKKRQFHTTCCKYQLFHFSSRGGKWKLASILYKLNSVKFPFHHF